MKVAVVALVILAGCDDPSLRVEVIATEGFAVATTTVTVYQSDTLTCRDIELGFAGTDTLSAAFVAEAVLELGDELVGVSRLEPKLFVAEARDADGRRLYAGCEARGEITGNEVVTISTFAIATTSINGDSVDKPFGQRQIRVAAIDANGRPIDERHVEWASYGVHGSFAGAGEMMSDPQLCTRRGAATIEPRDPETPGPIAAQVRVSWADATPPPLSGFIQDVAAVSLDRGGARKAPACAVRREATGTGGAIEDRVYCLQSPLASDPDDRTLVELDLGGNGQPFLGPVLGSYLSHHVLATDDDGDGRDDLYAVERVASGSTRVQWTGVAGTADPASPPIDACAGITHPECELTEVAQVVHVPGCGVGDGFVAINFSIDGNGGMNAGVGATPYVVVFTDLRGNQLPVSPLAAMADVIRIDLLAGGCVAEATTEATVHQAFAARITTGDPVPSVSNLLIADCAGQPCTARWQGFGAVGFSRGAAPRLISSELDISGNVIVESEVVIGQNGLLLIEKARTQTAAAARAITTGDIDLDGNEDLAWSQFLADDAGITANRVQIAVGRDGLPFAGRLTGISPVLTGAQAAILMAKIDDDDVPDLVTYSGEEAAVYRSGVTIEAGDAPGEETLCP
jgi:hypothetical protein